MSYITPRYDTENMFPSVCTGSQQRIEVEDNTRLRMGNNSGNVKLAHRDITDGAISNNDFHRFEKISGSSANQFRYFPSTASSKEHNVNSKNFDNLGFTSPNQWKNNRYNQKQTSGTTSGTTVNNSQRRNERFSSSTNQQNGVYSLEDELRKQREGFCGCNAGRFSFKSKPVISSCCVAAVVIIIIALLFVFLYKPKNKCCNDYSRKSNNIVDEMCRNGIFLC